jgi:hypothetical protein
MSKIEVFENRKPVLGINSLGRIGKLTLWHHIGRKYFHEIVVNVGRGVGSGLSAIAQLIEKDSTYGSIHRFLYGVKAKRLIQIVDEKKGALLIDGIPVTILREARNPAEIGWRNYGVDVVAECTGKFQDPTVAPDDKSGSIRGHLAGGAKVAINSAPFKIKNKALSMAEEAVTLVYGINHGLDYRKHPRSRVSHYDGSCVHGRSSTEATRNISPHPCRRACGHQPRDRQDAESREKDLPRTPQQHHPDLHQCGRGACPGHSRGEKYRFYGGFDPGAYEHRVADRP